MYYSISSYTVGSYEAYLKDVLVLQEVAVAVAAEMNADAGNASVDANALADVLIESVLPATPEGAKALGAADGGTVTEGSSLSALRELNTDAVGVAARQLTDTLLRPVDAGQMAASTGEADAKGVSGLSVAMAVAVVESLGATAKSTAAVAEEAPLTASGQEGEAVAGSVAASAEDAQDKALTRMQDATSKAWTELAVAASSSDAQATAQSAQHVDTMIKAQELLSSGVVQVQVNEQLSTATLAAAVQAPPEELDTAPAVVASLAAIVAAPIVAPALLAPLWQAPLAQDGAPSEASKEAEAAPPPPPLKRFIWVVKQVLAWRWREHTVTVVKENASASQALDDKKTQDKEHSQEDRRYLKLLERQAIDQKAAWLHAEEAEGKAG